MTAVVSIVELLHASTTAMAWMPFIVSADVHVFEECILALMPKERAMRQSQASNETAVCDHAADQSHTRCVENKQNEFWTHCRMKFGS